MTVVTDVCRYVYECKGHVYDCIGHIYGYVGHMHTCI